MSITQTNLPLPTTEVDKPTSKYYVAKEKEECQVCGAVYFQGYRNRHLQSQQHLSALQIIRNYLERTFLKDIYVSGK